MGIDFWMCEGGFELLAPFRAEGSSRDVKRLKTNLFGTVFGAGYFLRTSPWMCEVNPLGCAVVEVVESFAFSREKG